MSNRVTKHSTGGGTGDNKVKVDSSDTTAGYLTSKLSAGTGIAFNILNSGADEILEISSTVTSPVTSVFGRTGAVLAVSGDYNTSQVTESGNLYFTNARSIASVLTGYVSGAGTISATDSVLSAIQKLNGNISALVTGVSSVFTRTGAVTAQSGDYTTAQVTESGNLYFTNARAIASTLTGYVSGAGTISATDTILIAIEKLNGNISALVTGVSSVTATNATLTISPNTGAVSAGINLANANTWTGVMTLSPTARTTGSASYFTINSPADTGITANTESRGVNITGSTRTWADGTVPSQSEYYLGAPTYNKTTTAVTFTKAGTFTISGSPIAGTGVTISEKYSLWVQSGISHFGASTSVASATIMGGLGMEVMDTSNTTGGVNVTVQNTNAGSQAFCTFTLFNDQVDAGLTKYANLAFNSSTYSDTTFGSAFAIPNQLELYGTIGSTLIGACAVTGFINFIVGGVTAADEIARLNPTNFTVSKAFNFGTTASSTSGILLNNTTGALVGAQQLSPATHYIGRGWATGSGGSSQSVEFAIDLLPVQGSTNPSSTLRFLSSINGAAYTNPYSFNSGGGFTCSTITTASAGTQSIGGTTINLGGNTTTTTANILGGATINTAISTVNINQGATASGGTKTTNISTQGLAGSTTNISIGSALGTSVVTFAGQITLSDATNIAINATTGTKIGTATTQKIGFWNATPVVQPTGYGTPTGNSQTANFPGATATLLQTSQELAQLLLDLKSEGILGA